MQQPTTEQHIDITTADGAMNSFIVLPQAAGPHPVVLLYMDAPGWREELRNMARRLAAAGYLVVLPNLYYRRSRQYELRERTEAGLAEMYAHMDSLDARTSEVDTAALLAWVDACPQADASRVGAVGYCMSGPFVMWAAVAFPDRLRSIASIHGARLVTNAADSPHRIVGDIRCESYFACAENDKWASQADIATLQTALTQAGTPHRIEWYPGVEHGFVFPGRVGVYDAPAAELHWQRLIDLFGRTLAATV